MMEQCDVRQATHVKYMGQIFRIKSKWGIDTEGRLFKPSMGGFGIVTEEGHVVNMYEAELYFKEEDDGSKSSGEPLP